MWARRIVEEIAANSEGVPEGELKRRLSAGYPREMRGVSYPYRMYREEARRVLGLTRRNRRVAMKVAWKCRTCGVSGEVDVWVGMDYPALALAMRTKHRTASPACEAPSFAWSHQTAYRSQS